VLSALTDPFLRDAILAGLFLAATFSLLGVFVVLRRIVFIGITLAQVASAGTAFSFFLTAVGGASFGVLASAWWLHWGEILCSGIFTLLAVLAISGGSQKKQIPSEAVIGFAFAAFWALGILLVSRSGQGIAKVQNLVQGDLLMICTSHLIIVGGVALVTWGVLLVFWKEHLLVSFDPAMAQALGFRIRRWDLIFYCLLGLAVVSGIRYAGLLLIFTYLVVPPVTGLILGSSVEQTAILSVASALLATVLGLGLSFQWDLPASPLIAMLSVGFALLAVPLSYLTHKPQRGR
jgi:ABC-type Mn2+/Zn2+ transport system permease subunit